MSDWIERHSVNCIKCGALVDERECIEGPGGEGSICPVCQPKEVNFEEITLISEDGRVKVVLEWIGEGNDGDYQEDDPEDEPLLRFSVYRHYEPGENLEEDQYFLDDWNDVGWCEGDDGWRPVSDGSYCTALAATLPRADLLMAAKHILATIEGDISSRHRCKGLMEELSWLSAGTIEEWKHNEQKNS
jgi:hypothetical protein